MPEEDIGGRLQLIAVVAELFLLEPLNFMNKRP
jgi:hypothetical protein